MIILIYKNYFHPLTLVSIPLTIYIYIITCYFSFFGRRFLQPSWAKKRWYFLLVPMGISSVLTSALFIRTYLFPEEPPLPEAEAAELEAVANALNLKCFENPQGLALPVCIHCE